MSAPSVSKRNWKLYAKPPTRKLDVSQIFDKFNMMSANGLKYPKVRLTAKAPGASTRYFTEASVQFHISGDKARNPGRLVVSAGLAFGTPGGYYGAFDQDGTYHGRFENVPVTVRDVIREFAKDPAAAIVAHGLESGHCAICTKKLTHKHSLEAGVGPICARRMGIPYRRISKI